MKEKERRLIGKELHENVNEILQHTTDSRDKKKGLADSIRQNNRRYTFFTPIRILFKHSRNIECLAEDKKVTLSGIVQEQMKNVIKYSKASIVNIELLYAIAKQGCSLRITALL